MRLIVWLEAVTVICYASSFDWRMTKTNWDRTSHSPVGKQRLRWWREQAAFLLLYHIRRPVRWATVSQGRLQLKRWVYVKDGPRNYGLAIGQHIPQEENIAQPWHKVVQAYVYAYICWCVWLRIYIRYVNSRPRSSTSYWCAHNVLSLACNRSQETVHTNPVIIMHTCLNMGMAVVIIMHIKMTEYMHIKIIE